MLLTAYLVRFQHHEILNWWLSGFSVFLGFFFQSSRRGRQSWLLVFLLSFDCKWFCVSFSQRRELICSLWLWQFLVILTSLILLQLIWAATCDFQQCGILTSVDSDEPVQPTFKPRNPKLCSASSLAIIKYLSDKQRLWSDGWSADLLVAHTTLLEILCCGSIQCICFSKIVLVDKNTTYTKCKILLVLTKANHYLDMYVNKTCAHEWSTKVFNIFKTFKLVIRENYVQLCKAYE